ncbi:DUF2478 domain-containing protein [Pseudorhodobacter sp. MZDSW-24AT]|uniref:DUF2478 domain-containing protein n=1 Tax=Pseudorhodobacter sp. MZDSW-24AT TaxID=2052957 RepID=UPI000C1F6376|nr:DUF2478 domain-containing protein [Pseudorhodobacter sp. MZDSW-24AT]PJF09751.1 3-dehydroquinate dehydratase [Pseudorhodobacter sp. MZDSW-24AT]
MLGFISAPARGAGDTLLARVAARLTAQGVLLGGVVQVNTETDPDSPCLMDLRLLGGGRVIRISQSLGRHATGCRLDTAGLEEAAGLVAEQLHRARPHLLIVNKFGKQEAEGRGFRPVIAEAIALGVPVLTSVAEKNRAGFDLFSDGLASFLPVDEDMVFNWCLGMLANAAPETSPAA